MEDQKAFLKLLIAFVNDRDAALPEEPDWESLCELAAAQSLLGIFYYMVRKLPPDGQPPAPLMQKLEWYYHQTIIKSTQQNFAVSEAEKALCEAKIEYVPYKGYVIRRHYPAPDLRTMGDIDMLVREEDQTRVQKVLTGMGYTFDGNFDDVWVYKQNNVCLEIHSILRYLRDENGKLLELAGVWENVENSEDSEYKKVFTDEFQLVLLIAHMVKHFFFAGCGIRLALDVVFFLKAHPGMDWDKVIRWLHANRLDQAFYFMAGYSERVFGIPVNLPDKKECSDEQYEKLSCEFLKSNTFGAYDSRLMKNYRIYQRDHKKQTNTKTAKKITRRQFIFTFLFMPVDKMKLSRPYLNKYPWLLPFAYISRLVCGVFKKDIRKMTKNRFDFVRNVPDEAIEQAERKAEIHDLLGIY